MAVEVSKVGNAFLWLSSVKDDDKARELTDSYDADIRRAISSVRRRITKMRKHAEDGKAGLVERMRVKTDKMIRDLASTVARRGSSELCQRVDALKKEAESISVGTWGAIKEIEKLL
jgi:signal transduction histidine kinase